MNIMEWFDATFLQETIGLLDDDLLDVFGLEPFHVQFALVFLFMLALMWVVKPVIEWMMLNHWKTLSSYTACTLIALVFLQLVDRYAMADTTSTLPGYYWSVCLLAISSFGLVYVGVKGMRKLYVRLTKRSKRKAA
ncbi:hypothetical protein SAMN04487936_105162 [Halobacillus dabanensis]|uniref:Uncharacterized protein n=1 Tax=Halobacillus dabanensis TaxID=240302 RepID=A0A1I3V6E1_HALDA|nr:hypothetical protein [Halobacillus dabanensis]SFJ90865.1 hypothetical protein SAMN04487936_105162 [Halobacillus dabanensis]